MARPRQKSAYRFHHSGTVSIFFTKKDVASNHDSFIRPDFGLTLPTDYAMFPRGKRLLRLLL